MIEWGSVKQDADIQVLIAQRAVDVAKLLCIKYEFLDALMDIRACHNNGCPLQLVALHEADDLNFAHDVLGIRANLDRKTGRLTGGFLPRYATKVML